jgi:gliding motility-associated-like protein
MKSYLQLFSFVFLLFIAPQILKAGTPPSANFIHNPSPVCINTPNTFVDQSTGGVKIVSWNWSFGNGASIANYSGQNPPAITYSTSGTKSVTLTVLDSLGNAGSATQIVNVLAAFANAGSNAAICSSSSVQIGAATQAGYSYSWTPSSGLSSASIANPIANPATTTTYTLTAVASNGCAATSQVIITNIGNVSAHAGVDKIICQNSSTTIGASNQAYYLYSWSPINGLSTPTASQTVANPTTTTTYILSVQAGGCNANDTVVVNVIPAPTAPANDTFLKCAISNVTIGSVAIGGNSYAWSPATNLSSSSIANPVCSVTTSTLYTETITNSLNGCAATRTTFVKIYSPLLAFAGLNQSVCFGNSIILGGSPIVASGGSGNYNFNWIPVSSLTNINTSHPTATPTITTTYHLTVTDQLGIGCGSATDSVVLTIVPLPHPTIAMPTEFCSYSTPTALTGTPAGGVFSGAGIINNVFYPNDPSITLGVPYPITYSYNSNGCIYDTTISIVVYQAPVADAGLDQLICTNQGQTSVTLSASGGTNYSWTPTSTLSNANIFNPIASPHATTKYFVDVTLNGCTSRDSVTITVSSTCGVDSILIANPDFVRVPSGKTSVINYVANDNLLNGSLSYTASLFSFAKHGIANFNKNKLEYTPNYNYIGLDTFVYLLLDTTVGAFHNHTVFDTAHVIITVAPDAKDDYYFVHCDDSIVKNPLLNDSTGNGLYPVSFNIVAQPHNGTVAIVGNTFHYVANLSFVGQDSFAYSVCVNNICDTAIVRLTISCINPPIAIDDNLDVPNNQTTATNETANDIYDPTAPISITIFNGPMHGTASVVNNNINYTPSNGYIGIDSIEYIICNAVGCDTAWIILKVYDNSPCAIPSGFSPNGDGINDYLIINCAPLYDHSKLVIFNRWGNEVFSKVGYNNDWDGTYNNSKVPDGTYYYMFDPNDGVQKVKTGFIEIRK